MSGLSNSVSISKVVLIFIYFISLMFHSVFCFFLVVFGLFIFLQLISFRSSSFHSLRNVANVDRKK